VDFRSTVGFFLLRSCCLTKITTMRFNFLQLLDRILLYLFRRRYVITSFLMTSRWSSLRIDVIILGINFLFS